MTNMNTCSTNELLRLRVKMEALLTILGGEESLATLRDWVKLVEDWKADSERKATLGAGPCPGDDDDTILQCYECCTYADDMTNEDTKLGDPCSDPDSPDCKGVLQYIYDHESTEHDFDGGNCWRCGGREPNFIMDEPGFQEAPTFPIRFKTAKALLVALEMP